MSEEAFCVQMVGQLGRVLELIASGWFLRYCFPHSNFRVRYHLLPTFPLLRFDLVALVYTSSPLCR